MIWKDNKLRFRVYLQAPVDETLAHGNAGPGISALHFRE
jgi:hypothetical protein